MMLLPCTVALTSAHPGHGLLEHGAGHVAGSAYHMVVLLALGLMLFAVGQVVRSEPARRYLRVAGATALVMAGILLGFGF